MLRNSIMQNPRPLKWPEIAKSVPNRTGKQCRERYFNHLKPTLKNVGWSPVEDAMLCHLYQALGSRWALIAKHLRGRTDNGAKNRFHHIRRRLEKQASKGSSLAPICVDGEDVKKQVMNQMKNFATRASEDVKESLVDVVAASIESDERSPLEYDDFSFGPFHKPKHGSNSCTRCGLLVPSRQTGNTVCKRTGWCQSCVETPAYLTGDLLRIRNSLRSIPTSSHPPDRICL